MTELKKEVKVIETYHSPFKRKTITVIDRDEKGEKIPIVDDVTGRQLRINKVPQYEESKITFNCVISKASLGYDSVYVVNEETPKHIADALAILAADPTSDIKTEEEWIKMKNPDRYKEIERRKAYEAQVKAEYEEKLKNAKAEGRAEVEAELTVTKQELSNTKGALTKANNGLDKLNAQVKKLEESAKK